MTESPSTYMYQSPINPDKWGWTCDYCHETTPAVLGHELSHMLWTKHTKSRAHRSLAITPTRWAGHGKPLQTRRK